MLQPSSNALESTLASTRGPGTLGPLATPQELGKWPGPLVPIFKLHAMTFIEEPSLFYREIFARLQLSYKCAHERKGNHIKK